MSAAVGEGGGLLVNRKNTADDKDQNRVLLFKP